MARKLVSTAVLTLIAVALTVPAPAAAVVPEGFSEVVVLGTNSVSVSADVVVSSGDVVANDASPGPTLKNNFELYVDRKVTISGSLLGDSIKIFNQTSIGGDVSYNELDNSGSIAGNLITPLALPVLSPLPLFFTGPSDGPDVTVPDGGSQTLAPGSYGDVVVGSGATLHLTGGVYDVRSIDLVSDDGRLTFGAPSEVRIADKIRTRKNAFIGPADGSGVAASEIVFYVAGINGSDGELGSHPEAARIGSGSTVQANFFAPNGTLRLEMGVVATGAFLGRDVQLDRAAQLTLDTFFLNEPPVAGDDSATVAEGGSTSILDSGETSLLANDTDPNADNLSVSATPVTPPAHGLVVLNADGTFTYTHDGSETTADAFEYEVCDDGVEPGPLCDVGLVAITITPVNDPPDAQDDAATTDEDVPVLIDVLANDSDVDGNLVPSSVTVVSGPSNGTTSVDSGTGAVTYSPALNFNGSDSFVYEVCDDGSPLPSECSTATVSITVNAVNDPPDAQDDAATTDEEAPVTIDVLANDSDLDGNLVPSSVTVTSGPSNGTTSVDSGTGAVTYTPNLNFNGSDSFVYEVCDDGSPLPSECSTATVSITVNAVNDPPDAVDDTVTTDEDVPVVIDVLANDSDVDGNLVPSSVTVTDPPDLGGQTEVDPATGAVTYTPRPGFTGAESFVYQVCDDGSPLPAECGSATVTVTVTPVNEAPVAFPDDVLSDAATVDITLVGADGDGDTLTFSIVSGPSAGSLSTITPLTATTASVTYTADTPGASDAFTFQVDDGNGGTDQAEIRINPPPESDDEPPPPLGEVVTSDLSVETSEDTAVDVQLSGAAPDGVVLSFTIVSGPASGSLGAVTSTGDTTATVRYTPNAGFAGGDSFDFQACGDIDGSGDTGQAGECATATVSVSVAAVEDSPPPTAPDFSISTPKDTPVTLDLGSGSTTGDEPTVDDRRLPAGPRLSGSAAAQRVGAGGNGALPSAAPQLGRKAQTAITVGAGWSATTNVPPAFFWSGSAPVQASDGPFTFTLSGFGCVSVTDDFLPGDRFRLFDNGEVIGSTPRVAFGDPQTDDVEQGPDAAFADPTYSSATFGLDAGSHSISIEIIESPASGGRGYIRVDEAGSPLCTAGNVYTIETLPSNGTLLDAGGNQITAGQTLTDLSVTYVPNAGFVGTESFTYSITDQLLQKTTATVSVSVIDPGLEACDTCVTLTIEKLGTGNGTVASNPQAVLCSAECSIEVAPGSFLVLLARPDDAFSEFTGWGGDCSGTSPILGVTVDTAKTCTATFDSVP